MTGIGILFLSITVLFFLIASAGVKIVPQAEEFAVEQFGKYVRTLKPGLNFIVPLFQKIAHKVNILERPLKKEGILVITKDNVKVTLDTVVFYRIIDLAKSVYRIRDVSVAVETTTTSVVRATGGQMEFDEIQSQRDKFNQNIEHALAETCAIWGIEITRTEILDVIVDAHTSTAIQQQLNAERSRRATVTLAEGEKTAQHLKADAELYTAQKRADARRVLAEADAYATTTVGNAIQENGQPAIEFEVRKLQAMSLAELGKSPGSKLVVIPTDVTKSLGSLMAFAETLSAAR